MPMLSDGTPEDNVDAVLPDGIAMCLARDTETQAVRHRMNNFGRHFGREGPLTPPSRLLSVTRIAEGLWTTTIYTADSKIFDAELADPVAERPIRPAITTVLDVVMRKVVDVIFVWAENQRAVAEALRNACLDTRHSRHLLC